MRHLCTRIALVLGVILAGGWAPPAQAASSVSVDNADGDAVADPTYATSVTISGRGFQAIKGGHGGVYVLFGTVSGRWRPSQGGRSGADYYFIPDSQTKNNAGYERFIAFPGSDTASGANAVMSASGSWTTTLTVPGAVFTAATRDGGTKRIDCRQVACGVITIGAHGVVNDRNETFTRVRFDSLYGAQDDPSTAPVDPGTSESTGGDSTPAGSGDSTDSTDPGGSDGTQGSGSSTGGAGPTKGSGPAALEIDRDSAVAGNVLAFTATGMPPGRQVSVILDDGAAAAGPFVAGADGHLAGVISLPADAAGGTHQLRVFGMAKPPSINFAIAEAESATIDPDLSTVAASADSGGDSAGPVFAIVAGVVFLAALVRVWWLRRAHGGRR